MCWRNPAPDLSIHCGDVEGSEDYICEIAGCPVQYGVAGNNDFFSDLNREEEFDLESIGYG